MRLREKEEREKERRKKIDRNHGKECKDIKRERKREIV